MRLVNLNTGLVLAVLLIAGCAEHAGHVEQVADTASPYAGEEQRDIKSLDAKTIEGYQTGAGMGLAKVAELNQYPGPKHVLELAEGLALDPAQREAIQISFDTMQQKAIALGMQIIEQEEAAEALFAEAQAEPNAVQALFQQIGALQGELRFVHVQAHLEMKKILTPEQIQKYTDLRGYGADHNGNHEHMHNG